jgi:hypothetical protein
MKYEVEPGSGDYRHGTITFYSQRGKSLDLATIHACLQTTRLAGKTRSAVNYLEITATGQGIVVKKDTPLTAASATPRFALGDDPKAEPTEGTKTPFRRLCEALAKGVKVLSVTGRVHGWSGPWPAVLRALSGGPAEDSEKSDETAATKPPLLIVTDFQTAQE